MPPLLFIIYVVNKSNYIQTKIRKHQKYHPLDKENKTISHSKINSREELTHFLLSTK